MNQKSASRLTGSLIAITVATILGTGNVAVAQPQVDSKRFDISDQLLATALNEFARQSDRQILFSTEVVNAKHTSGVKGELEPEAALQRLLKGTGLTYRVTSDNTILVEDARSGRMGPERLIRLAQASPSSQSGEDVRETVEGSQGPSDQNTENQKVGEEAQPQKRVELEEIVITGTHISEGQNVAAHVIVIDRHRIEQTGYGNASQLIASIPQNFAGGASQTVTSNMTRDGSQFNQGVGTGVNLRGLGTGATLTLLNGSRVAPAGQGSFVDISLIPLSAIERVEVLTDGASAIYGSDAIGGVVNIITRRDFDGAETRARYGAVTSGGRQEYSLSQLFGHSWTGGNLTLNYEHAHEDALTALDRPDMVAQGGRAALDLLPQQTLNSVLTSLYLDLSPNLRFTGELLGSDRKFVQRTTPLTNPAAGTGHSRGGAVTTTLEARLSSSWSLRVIGDYSRNVLIKNLQLPSQPAPLRSDSTYDTWSAEVRADGSTFHVPAGDVKLAVGAAYRSEAAYQETVVGAELLDSDRSITSAYAELLLPLLQHEERNGFESRLDLSLAGRFDRYSDFGDTTNPRAALAWQPVRGVVARTTYSRSFHAPLFFQNLPGNNFAYIADVPDPQSTRPDGRTSTVTYYGPNTNLGPERARSWTAGLEFRSQTRRGLSGSLGYFDIDYKQRVVDLQAQNPTGFLTQGAAFAPFVVRSPSDSLLTSVLSPLVAIPRGIMDFNTFQPVTDLGAALTKYDIGAFFDARYHNATSSRIRGIDGELAFDHDLRLGNVSVGLSASYLLDYANKFTSDAPSTDVLNTVFHPVDLRVRASAGWRNHAWAVNGFINYVDSYSDPGTAYSVRGSIPSWTTFDVQIRFEPTMADSSWIRGVAVSLTALNLFDREPPHLIPTAGQFAFDAENANPLGRFVALSVSKRLGEASR